MSEPLQALQALVRGELARWTGLADGSTRAVVEGALGGTAVAEGPILLFGTGATLCRYPAVPAAPSGVVVWYVDGAAALVEIPEPALPEPVEAQLGPPEAKVPSLLGSIRTQLVYAGRGLVVHASNLTDLPYRIYGFRACPVEEFLAGPLRSVRSVRIPR